VSNPSLSAPDAPDIKAMVWIDGQNLFHRAKSIFGHKGPDYDIRGLSQGLCDQMGWKLECIHFYSGIPPEQESPRWHHFWREKLQQAIEQGGVPIHTFTPELRYRNEWTQRHDGQWQIYRAATEKGVDVRLALDMVDAAHERQCDAMVLMSEDSDLQQAVDRCKEIARKQGRDLPIANAFPHNPAVPIPRRSMALTIPLRFDQAFYEKHIQQVQMRHHDPRDHGAIDRAHQAMQAANQAPSPSPARNRPV
jgi:NYN domain